MLKPLLKKLKSRINNEYILLQEINKCKTTLINEIIKSIYKGSPPQEIVEKLINEFSAAIRKEIISINLTSIITISSNALLG
jgi:hypothetical protein